MLYNCSDFPLAANNYMYEEDLADYQDFPCQWGADSGNCTNPVFAGICAHTCQPFRTFRGINIGGEVYTYQLLDKDGVGPDDYPCYIDNDDAAAELAAEHFIPGFLPDPNGPGACHEVAYHVDLDTVEFSPCHYHNYTFAFAALCKVTCATHPPPTDPSLVMPRTDEADVQGAKYGDNEARRLRVRQMLDATVSHNGGPQTTE